MASWMKQVKKGASHVLEPGESFLAAQQLSRSSVTGEGEGTASASEAPSAGCALGRRAPPEARGASARRGRGLGRSRGGCRVARPLRERRAHEVSSKVDAEQVSLESGVDPKRTPTPIAAGLILVAIAGLLRRFLSGLPDSRAT